MGRVLEWCEFDSEIYGVDFYRALTSDVGLVADAIAALQAPTVVDLKLDSSDPNIVDAFAALGFRKASVLVELELKVSSNVVADKEALDRLELKDADLEAHAQGFRFQRFRQDGRLPEAASVRLMRSWIANSLAGRRETCAIGRNFCTFSVAEKRLTIDLLSCIDQSQGVAGRLLDSVHSEAAQRGMSEIRVTTEAENVAALRTYVRAGFRPAKSWAAMHYVQLEAQS